MIWIWWPIFIALYALYLEATVYFVPLAYRINYVKCPKDMTYWASLTLQHSIWMAAAIESFIAPGDLPALPRLVGVFLFACGSALFVAARRVNPLFLPIIVYVPPADRATDGPYKWISHPGYWGLILAAMGVALMLGQRWAAFPMIAYVGLITYRMIKEDLFLSRQQSL